MSISMSSALATAHTADLHRVADQRRPIRSMPQPSAADAASSPVLEFRQAGADDGRKVEDLAALDDAPVLTGEVLLALIDGEAVAALSLFDGRVVANPFRRTDAAVALLRLRAEHVFGRRARRRWPVIPRPRFA
jgi:hypothetical protein